MLKFTKVINCLTAATNVNFDDDIRIELLHYYDGFSYFSSTQTSQCLITSINVHITTNATTIANTTITTIVYVCL